VRGNARVVGHHRSTHSAAPASAAIARKAG